MASRPNQQRSRRPLTFFSEISLVYEDENHFLSCGASGGGSQSRATGGASTAADRSTVGCGRPGGGSGVESKLFLRKAGGIVDLLSFENCVFVLQPPTSFSLASGSGGGAAAVEGAGRGSLSAETNGSIGEWDSWLQEQHEADESSSSSSSRTQQLVGVLKTATEVTYGAKFMLRHRQSGHFVTILSSQPSDVDPDSQRVSLMPAADAAKARSVVFRFVPRYKIHNEGDAVCEGDTLLLQCVANKLFLHLSEVASLLTSGAGGGSRVAIPLLRGSRHLSGRRSSLQQLWARHPSGIPPSSSTPLSSTRTSAYHILPPYDDEGEGEEFIGGAAGKGPLESPQLLGERSHSGGTANAHGGTVEVNGSEHASSWIVRRYDVGIDSLDVWKALSKGKAPVMFGVPVALLQREQEALLTSSVAKPRSGGSLSTVGASSGSIRSVRGSSNRAGGAHGSEHLALRRRGAAGLSSSPLSASSSMTASSPMRQSASRGVSSVSVLAVSGSNAAAAAPSGSLPSLKPMLLSPGNFSDAAAAVDASSRLGALSTTAPVPLLAPLGLGFLINDFSFATLQSSCATYWIIEAANPSIGGPVHFGVPCRLRQAATNMYLAVVGDALEDNDGDGFGATNRSPSFLRKSSSGTSNGYSSWAHWHEYKLESTNSNVAAAALAEEADTLGALSIALVPAPSDVQGLERTLFTFHHVFHGSEPRCLTESDFFRLRHVETGLWVCVQDETAMATALSTAAHEGRIGADVDSIPLALDQRVSMNDAWMMGHVSQRAYKDVLHVFNAYDALHKYREIFVKYARARVRFGSGNGGLRTTTPVFSTATPGASRVIRACTDALVSLIYFCTDSDDQDPLEREGLPIAAHQQMLFDLQLYRIVFDVIVAPLLSPAEVLDLFAPHDGSNNVRARATSPMRDVVGTGDGLPEAGSLSPPPQQQPFFAPLSMPPQNQSGELAAMNLGVAHRLPKLPLCTNGATIVPKKEFDAQHAQFGCLHNISRLAFRLIKQMVMGNPYFAAELAPYIPLMFELDGMKLHVVEVMHQIFTENSLLPPDVVARAVDHYVLALTGRQRSAGYLKFLATMCAANHDREGIRDSQELVCRKLLLLHGGASSLQAPATSSVVIDTVLLPSGHVGVQWSKTEAATPIARFLMSHSDSKLVKYFEGQMELYAKLSCGSASSLCLDTLEKKFPSLQLNGVINTILWTGEEVSGKPSKLDATRCNLFKLAMNLYVVPELRNPEVQMALHTVLLGSSLIRNKWIASATSITANHSGVADKTIMASVKLAATKILQANPFLVIPDRSRNELLRVVVSVWHAFIQYRQYSTQEVQQLLPILLQLLDSKCDRSSFHSPSVVLSPSASFRVGNGGSEGPLPPAGDRRTCPDVLGFHRLREEQRNFRKTEDSVVIMELRQEVCLLLSTLLQQMIYESSDAMIVFLFHKLGGVRGSTRAHDDKIDSAVGHRNVTAAESCGSKGRECDSSGSSRVTYNPLAWLFRLIGLQRAGGDRGSGDRGASEAASQRDSAGNEPLHKVSQLTSADVEKTIRTAARFVEGSFHPKRLIPTLLDLMRFEHDGLTRSCAALLVQLSSVFRRICQVVLSVKISPTREMLTHFDRLHLVAVELTSSCHAVQLARQSALSRAATSTPSSSTRRSDVAETVVEEDAEHDDDVLRARDEFVDTMDMVLKTLLQNYVPRNKLLGGSSFANPSSLSASSLSRTSSSVGTLHAPGAGAAFPSQFRAFHEPSDSDNVLVTSEAQPELSLSNIAHVDSVGDFAASFAPTSRFKGQLASPGSTGALSSPRVTGNRIDDESDQGAAARQEAAPLKKSVSFVGIAGQPKRGPSPLRSTAAAPQTSLSLSLFASNDDEISATSPTATIPAKTAKTRWREATTAAKLVAMSKRVQRKRNSLGLDPASDVPLDVVCRAELMCHWGIHNILLNHLTSGAILANSPGYVEVMDFFYYFCMSPSNARHLSQYLNVFVDAMAHLEVRTQCMYVVVAVLSSRVVRSTAGKHTFFFHQSSSTTAEGAGTATTADHPLSSLSAAGFAGPHGEDEDILDPRVLDQLTTMVADEVSGGKKDPDHTFIRLATRHLVQPTHGSSSVVVSQSSCRTMLHLLHAKQAFRYLGAPKTSRISELAFNSALLDLLVAIVRSYPVLGSVVQRILPVSSVFDVLMRPAEMSSSRDSAGSCSTPVALPRVHQCGYVALLCQVHFLVDEESPVEQAQRCMLWTQSSAWWKYLHLLSRDLAGLSNSIRRLRTLDSESAGGTVEEEMVASKQFWFHAVPACLVAFFSNLFDGRQFGPMRSTITDVLKELATTTADFCGELAPARQQLQLRVSEAAAWLSVCQQLQAALAAVENSHTLAERLRFLGAGALEELLEDLRRRRAVYWRPQANSMDSKGSPQSRRISAFPETFDDHGFESSEPGGVERGLSSSDEAMSFSFASPPPAQASFFFQGNVRDMSDQELLVRRVLQHHVPSDSVVAEEEFQHSEVVQTIVRCLAVLDSNGNERRFGVDFGRTAADEATPELAGVKRDPHLPHPRDFPLTAVEVRAITKKLLGHMQQLHFSAECITGLLNLFHMVLSDEAVTQALTGQQQPQQQQQQQQSAARRQRGDRDHDESKEANFPAASEDEDDKTIAQVSAADTDGEAAVAGVVGEHAINRSALFFAETLRRRVVQRQNLFNQVGLMRVVTNLSDLSDHAVTKSALDLGIALLEGGNISVQNGMLHYFDTHDESFFHNVRDIIASCYRRVHAYNDWMMLRMSDDISVYDAACAPGATSVAAADAHSDAVVGGADSLPRFGSRGAGGTPVGLLGRRRSVVTPSNALVPSGRVPFLGKGAAAIAAFAFSDDPRFSASSLSAAASVAPPPERHPAMLICELFRFIQLMCEGHHLGMQNYIRKQSDNLHSINIVVEVLTLVEELCAVRIDHKKRAAVVQSFDLLTELCQGPCAENQAALIANGVCMVIASVLSLNSTAQGSSESFTKGVEHERDNEVVLAVQNAASTTLLALIEGCSRPDVYERILQQCPLELIELRVRSLALHQGSGVASRDVVTAEATGENESSFESGRDAATPDDRESVDSDDEEGGGRGADTEGEETVDELRESLLFNLLIFAKSVSPFLERSTQYQYSASTTTQAGMPSLHGSDAAPSPPPPPALVQLTASSQGYYPFSPQSALHSVHRMFQYVPHVAKKLGMIQVERGGVVERVFFPIPEICFSLTQQSKDEVLWSVNRTSRHTKLSEFFQKIDELMFEVQSSHRFAQFILRVTRFSIPAAGHHAALDRLKAEPSSWYASLHRCLFSRPARFLRLILHASMRVWNESIAPYLFAVEGSYYERHALILAAVINVLFVFTDGVDKDDRTNSLVERVVRFLCLAQLVLYLLVFLYDSCVLLPVYFYHVYRQRLRAARVAVPFKEVALSEVLSSFPTWSSMASLALRRFATVYYLVLVLASVGAVFISPYFSAVTLCAVIYKSPTLRTVITAITQNGRSLGLTMGLGVIVVYLFSIVGYNYFPRAFDPEAAAASGVVSEPGVIAVASAFEAPPSDPDVAFTADGTSASSAVAENCQTLARCFVFILVNGMRQGGGVGDLMTTEPWGSNILISRMAYDFCFYALVNVLFINCLFGIIIDTFAELRDDKRTKEEDMATCCFICGLPADAFEKDGGGGGFRRHVKVEHNMWQYLYFIYHLRVKDSDDFTGQESYVYREIQHNSLNFFPDGKCLSLQTVSSSARRSGHFVGGTHEEDYGSRAGVGGDDDEGSVSSAGENGGGMSAAAHAATSASASSGGPGAERAQKTTKHDGGVAAGDSSASPSAHALHTSQSDPDGGGSLKEIFAVLQSMATEVAALRTAASSSSAEFDSTAVGNSFGSASGSVAPKTHGLASTSGGGRSLRSGSVFGNNNSIAAVTALSGATAAATAAAAVRRRASSIAPSFVLASTQVRRSREQQEEGDDTDTNAELAAAREEIAQLRRLLQEEQASKQLLLRQEKRQATSEATTPITPPATGRQQGHSSEDATAATPELRDDATTATSACGTDRADAGLVQPDHASSYHAAGAAAGVVGGTAASGSDSLLSSVTDSALVSLDSFRLGAHVSTATPNATEGLQPASAPVSPQSHARTFGLMKRPGNALQSPHEKDCDEATSAGRLPTTTTTASVTRESGTQTDEEKTAVLSRKVFSEATTQTDVDTALSLMIEDLQHELQQTRQHLKDASLLNQRYLHDLQTYAQYTQGFLEERKENAQCIRWLEDELARYEEAVPQVQEMVLRYLRDYRQRRPS